MKIGNVGNASGMNVYATHNVVKADASADVSTESSSVSEIGTPNSDLAVQKPHEAKDPSEAKDVSDDVLNEAVKQANQSLKLFDRKIERTVHEVTKAVIYTLRDTRTNEVIAEFPPKKIQDMIAKMWELAGVFVDKKA